MSPSNPQAGSPAQWGYAQAESAQAESAQPEYRQSEHPQPGESQPGEAQPVNGYLDPWARLTKLHALRNEGAITEADFQEHKRRILSDL